ncbi:MAG: FxSxx-COOH system tetratricopeptide repeat protein [Defluviicoccus sp.]|nr:FxSxx-COOH system tetratricopeptide repeat protein [Defluviicoccus sp.]MDG4593625.1 FxSxx-COOH system tetratricopeptide repeat protein [Defluviicoccus sp.]
MAANGGAKKDFFISYTGADQAWAEWVAWVLEAADYEVVIQAWDFRPGQSFVRQMQEGVECCARTLLVLSPRYFQSDFATAEWEAVFVKDPAGEGRLLPVRIEACTPPGLLGRLAYTDLFGLEKEVAKERMLAAVILKRAKPTTEPPFPPGRAVAATKPEPRFPGALPAIWNLTHRNPNFTGRVAQLDALRAHLTGGSTAAVTQAASISGLGGIGKSQLAIEYAYRYRGDYDLAWWLRAEEPGSLAADYAALARALDLPAKDAAEQAVVLAAVRAWLEAHRRWLLIFDNAEAPAPLKDLLPRGETGHVIITTRNPNFGGFAKVLPLDLWPRAESIAFLGQRTGDGGRDADALAEALGDLPLALEQAAAYCQATGESVAGYLAMLTAGHGAELLAEPREAERTVAAVWAASFARVEQESPAGAALLKLISFLAPDAIPLDLISGGAKHLAEPLAAAAAGPVRLNQAVAALIRYSLIRREGEMLSLHRLVQAVTRQRLDATEHNAWAGAAVSVLNAALPAFPHNTFDAGVAAAHDRLGAHALAAAEHAAAANVALEAAGRLFNAIGFYRRMRADLAGAKAAYSRALSIHETAFGPEHPKVAIRVNNIGGVLREEGDLAGARRAFERALAIDEKAFGPDHPEVATDVNNLGGVLWQEGDLPGARRAFERALEIDEKAFGPDHPEVATDVNNLGYVLREEGDLVGAKAAFERALAIVEKAFGPEHPNVATCVNNLGNVLRQEGDLAGAKRAFERALAIWEKCFGPDHPHTKKARANLAAVSKP